MQFGTLSDPIYFMDIFGEESSDPANDSVYLYR